MIDRLKHSKSAGFGIVIVLCIFVASCISYLAPSGIKTKFLQISPVMPRPATVPSSSDPTGDEWPMRGRQLNHTGVTTTTPKQWQGPMWNYTTGNSVYSSPAVAGGRVYVGSEDKNVYCLNASTGAFAWSYPTGQPIESSPAVAGERVYVGSYGKVCCLDATTGESMWNCTTGSWMRSSPAVAGGRVYVGDNDGNIFCLNATTGALVPGWPYTTGSGMISSPAVAGGRVYVGSGDGKVYCLDAITGFNIWSNITGSYVFSSPAVAGGRVYVGSNDCKVHCFNAITGSSVWNYTTGNTIQSSPAVASGRVYVGSGDGKVYCLNATTGELAWSYTTGSYVDSSPAIASGHVYVGCFDGKIYCLDAITGTLLWSYTTGSYVYSSPAIAGGRVYVGSWDNKVYCFPMIMSPSAPQTLFATPRAGSVTLAWQAPSVTYNSPINYYKIYRGTSPGNEIYTNRTSSPTTFFTDYDVTNGQKYYYTVSTVTGAGEGAQSNEASVKPESAPGVPMNLQTINGNRHITIIWQSPSDNGGSTITNYKIYRSTSSGNEMLYKTIGNVLTYTDTSVVVKQTYFYIVSAINWYGEGFQSNEASAIPTNVSSAPRSLSATPGNGQVVLTWQMPADNGGSAITNYNVYRGTVSHGETWFETIGNFTSLTDTSVVNGQVYYYNISAITSAGEGVLSNEAHATPATVPGAPQNLVATPGNGQVALSWQAPASNGGLAVWNYNIFRGMSSGGESYFTTLGHVYAWNDTGLTNGQIYYYTVDAINFAGEGEQAKEVVVTPAAVPGTPRSFTAMSESGYILLLWETPLDNGGSAITNYRIYRGIMSGIESSYMTIGNVTSCTDTSNMNGQLYYYKICAVTSAGEGSASNESSAIPSTYAGSPLNLVATAGISQVVLTWQAPLSNGGSAIINYRVYRGMSSGGEILVTTLGNVLTWTDTGRASGQIYYYTVSPINAAGEGPKTNEANATLPTLPGMPRNLVVTGGKGQVSLTWQAPLDNGGAAITNYMIYRGTSTGSEAWYMTIGNVTSLTDTSVVDGQTYYYTVIAVNEAGSGTQASEASVSVPATPSTPSSTNGLSTADDMVIVIAIVSCIAIIVVAFLMDARNKKVLATMARNFEQAPSKGKGKKAGSRYTDDAVSVEPSTSDRSDDPEPGS